MSYDSLEQSTEDGQPIELYSLESEGGGLAFNYTNWRAPITAFSRTFTPMHSLRNTIDQTNALVAPDATSFYFPLASDVGQWYGGVFSPPTLWVRCWRRHIADVSYKRLFVGKSDHFIVKDDVITVEAKPFIQALLHRVMCANKYGLVCNHDLFDNRCTVDRDDHTFTTEVVAINGQFITLANDHTPDDALRFGDAIINGEYRMIIRNVSDVIKVRYPYTTINIGDEVTLVRGCDKTKQTCKNVFDNYDNFGGYPLAPLGNPISVSKKSNIFNTIRLLPG